MICLQQHLFNDTPLLKRRIAVGPDGWGWLVCAIWSHKPRNTSEPVEGPPSCTVILIVRSQFSRNLAAPRAVWNAYLSWMKTIALSQQEDRQCNLTWVIGSTEYLMNTVRRWCHHCSREGNSPTPKKSLSIWESRQLSFTVTMLEVLAV
jgi:hypothetical protein